MTDSAETALSDESKNPGKETIIDQLERFAEENPGTETYWVDTEFEAAQILLAMAASLKLCETDITNDEAGLKKIREYANTYRQKCAQGKALNYLRTIDQSDELQIFGLTIKARRIVLN